MSTIILLDLSLSMCRPASRGTIPTDDHTGQLDIKIKPDDIMEIRQLANIGIGTLMDYFAQNALLERTALVVFSSLWEIKQEFTRHHESIKNGIYDLEMYDKSNVVNAVTGILQLKPQEIAQSEPVNIILITDGQLNCYHDDEFSTTNSDDDGQSKGDQFHDMPLSSLKGKFDFPCKLQVVCLSPESDPGLKHGIKFYKQLIKIIDGQGDTDYPVYVGSKSARSIHGSMVKLSSNSQSAIWLPDSDETGNLTIDAIEKLFLRIADVHYKPYRCSLACGHLNSLVLVSPKPEDYLLSAVECEYDMNMKKSMNLGVENPLNKETPRHFKLNTEISICGFLPVSDIASPAVISRHFIVPIYHERFNEILKAEQILSQDPSAYIMNTNSNVMQSGLIDSRVGFESTNQMDSLKTQIKIEKTAPATTNPPANNTNKNLDKASSGKNASSSSASGGTPSSSDVTNVQDITKLPSFCALLMNALKQDNKVAICHVGQATDNGEHWFGMLHAQADNKKRNSLILSLFYPSDRPILWLPDFQTMGSALLNADVPETIREKAAQVSANSRKQLKSYSSNNVIWLDPESVQTDIQKVVRHARRPVDKVAFFYKELNRIRRAAICYGFYDVLQGLASILEREKDMMIQTDQNKGTTTEMISHLENAVSSLRAPLTEESISTNIGPKV